MKPLRPICCIQLGSTIHISLTDRAAAAIRRLPSARTRVRNVLTGRPGAETRRAFSCSRARAGSPRRFACRGPKKGGDARCLDAGSCNALRGTLLTPPEPFRSGASRPPVPRTRRPSSRSTLPPQPFRALVALGPEGPFPHRYGSPRSVGVTNEKSFSRIFSGDSSEDKQLNYLCFWTSPWKTGG